MAAVDPDFMLRGTVGVSDRISTVKQLGDFGQAVVFQTIDINIAAAGTYTLYTPPVNAVFLVYAIAIQGDVVLLFKSGATILGRITHTESGSELASGMLQHNGGLPIIVGRAAGEAFAIEVSAACTGFLNVGYRNV